MSDLDDALRRLSQDPVPAGLDSMEERVLGRVAGHRFGTRESGGFHVLAIGGALLMGVAGGLLPQERPAPDHPLARLGGAADLSPSSLLVDR